MCPTTTLILVFIFLLGAMFYYGEIRGIKKTLGSPLTLSDLRLGVVYKILDTMKGTESTVHVLIESCPPAKEKTLLVKLHENECPSFPPIFPTKRFTVKKSTDNSLKINYLI